MKILRDEEKEKMYISHLRKMTGLRKIKTGKVECLSCERKFQSPNIVNNRICPRCRKLNGMQ
jgi:hypothetical protein